MEYLLGKPASRGTSPHRCEADSLGESLQLKSTWLQDPRGFEGLSLAVLVAGACWCRGKEVAVTRGGAGTASAKAGSRWAPVHPWPVRPTWGLPQRRTLPCGIALLQGLKNRIRSFLIPVENKTTKAETLLQRKALLDQMP